MKDEPVQVFGFITLGIIITIGLLAAIQMLRASPLWSTEGAAWVQAIGSIAAIVGTWAATSKQLRHAEHLRRVDRIQANVRIAQIACDLAADTQRVLQNIHSKFEKQRAQGACSPIGLERIQDLRESLGDLARKEVSPMIFSEMLILRREVAYTFTAILQHNEALAIHDDRITKAKKRLAAIPPVMQRLEDILLDAKKATGKNVPAVEQAADDRDNW